MAPRTAAERFRERYPKAASYRVTLYGSIAATGKGHLTDVVLADAFAPSPVEILWKAGEQLPEHPNGLELAALDEAGSALGSWRVYSVGGGAIRGEGVQEPASVYPHSTMAAIASHCEAQGLTLWEYVGRVEGEGVWEFLGEVWDAMGAAMKAGLAADGVLPGPLALARKARQMLRKAQLAGAHSRRTGMLAAYALAVAEQNASGGVVVTAPTCGASGVVPSVLRFLHETIRAGRADILRGLATAGLVGNLAKHNGSISGAEVGCQGEIGVACAMAAAAAAQLMGASVRQIEYAAEMGLEHHLGLTCDPVAGLVQIPCIERNAMAATRALTCADYSLFSDGGHRVSFDEVVAVMKTTGHDLPSLYRETASGGLAATHHAQSSGGR